MQENEKFLNELLTLKDQIRFGTKFEIPEGVKNVVIAGMGGSGVVGRTFSEMYSGLPVVLVKSYEIPPFVGKETLFICISYSGNTSETLAAFRSARNKGAHIVAITSGGTLSEEAGVVIKVPKGLQPRSAFGYMLMPLLNSFNAVSKEEIEEAYRVLDEIDKDNSSEENIAKEIYKGKFMPVIYGTSPYDSVAYRWSTQFNENSKLLAIWSNFPELDHNNTMALCGQYRKGEFYHICLLANEDPRIMKRIEATQEVAKIKFKSIVEPKGASRLAKVVSLVHMGDYVTYYLAKLLAVDPLDVSAIEELKGRLKGVA